MDRRTFDRKTNNPQRYRLDRFVATRDSFSETRRRRSWHAAFDVHPVNNDRWSEGNLKKKNYIKYLDKAFDLESPDKNKSIKRMNRLWPCIPRKKTYLSSADSILDLPTYSYAIYPELLDWSNDNMLVAALGSSYHKWSWRSQSLISHGYAEYEIQCCKFDPRGELLALGTYMKTLEIHNNSKSKKIMSNTCKCLEIDNMNCSITAVDWSPTGNSFAAGCSGGAVTSFTRAAKLISWRHLVREAILLIRVSPNARYLAVTAMNTALVLLLSWPSLEMYSSIDSDWSIRAICWHPWRSALLGVGAVTDDLQARIALWNAPTREVRDTSIGPKGYRLDAMLFSHRTGELVLSMWHSDRATLHPKTCSQLVVLSDPDTMVDQWGEGRSGLDRVRTMIFSPDGTKLATATTDEDLIIWNFLPEDNKMKKTKCRSFSALPECLDNAMLGYSLR